MTRLQLITILLAFVLVLSMLAGCTAGPDAVSSMAEQATTGPEAQVAAVEPMATGQEPQATPADLSASVARDVQDHEDAEADVLASAEWIPILLNGDSISVDGAGATAEGGTVTITSPGTYRLAGSLADGQVVVDAEDGVVGLALDGADVNSSTGPAIYILSAREAVIVLAEGTENHVSDGSARADTGMEDEPTAAIFSMADLTISGTGSLVVDGNYNDGIASKDGLVVVGGTIAVRAQDDGLRGKDYLIVRGGEMAVEAGGDGLKADNDVDASRGYVRIEGGSLDVTAGGDAIAGETAVMVADGELNLTSGGGHGGSVGESASAKGIKGLASVTVDDGILAIDSADDAIHSNGRIVVNGGTFVLSTGDDGMHADASLEINGGDVRVTDSYEGLESAAITINGGEIRVVSSDDGINVAAGNDESGFAPGPGRGGGQGQPPSGGPRGEWPGQDGFVSGDNYLHIHGGHVVVDARGDGLDVNGPIEMTDGVVLISGPTDAMNGALDYSGRFDLSGGFLVAAGSAGMAQAPSETSAQHSLHLTLDGTARAGTLIHVETAEGKGVLTFAPAKQYQSLVFSSPELERGVTYDVYVGGTSGAEVKDGLYREGNYASGTQYASFTVSGAVTRIGGRAW